ncbi:MAG: endolytic transglycosylase MltG [Candidatus Saccharibacteria bacterium]
MLAKRHKRIATIAIGVIGFVFVVMYINYRLGLHAASKSQVAQTFVVERGETAPKIADHLKAAKLIIDRSAFITYVNFHGLRPRIQAGTYSLRPSLSVPEIADILAHGRTQADRLIIPEGYTLAQIRTASAKFGISTADFNAAMTAPHTQSFLAGKPPSVDLEGYLFPDSYQIEKGTSASSLIDQMLTTFGRRVGSSYVQAFTAQGLNLHQALTLASIVEKEVSNANDRPIVAQVFLKRYKLGMPLGSDVTTQYAADQAGVAFNLELNSPYNTRKFSGLPPGPICNPGLSSLDAVAHPAMTDYLYFLAGRDGKTYFAKTYAEHQRNITLHL